MSTEYVSNGAAMQAAGASAAAATAIAQETNGRREGDTSTPRNLVDLARVVQRDPHDPAQSATARGRPVSSLP